MKEAKEKEKVSGNIVENWYERKRRAIKIVRPKDVFTFDEGKKKEFYFYKYRNGSKKCYRYRITYDWEIWKDSVEKAGCNWEDVQNHKLQIKLYPHGGIVFEKINKGGKKNESRYMGSEV